MLRGLEGELKGKLIPKELVWPLMNVLVICNLLLAPLAHVHLIPLVLVQFILQPRKHPLIINRPIWKDMNLSVELLDHQVRASWIFIAFLRLFKDGRHLLYYRRYGHSLVKQPRVIFHFSIIDSWLRDHDLSGIIIIYLNLSSWYLFDQ